jgi:uncharacterized phage protein (TIGR02218 family)
MKNISPAMKTELQQNVTHLSTCWKLTRKDGVVMGFTDFNEPLIVDDFTYQSLGGFSPTTVQTTAALAVDNLEVIGVLDASMQAITEADIRAGLYDFAYIEIFMVNHADLSMGVIKLRSGWIGEITIKRGEYVAELRGLLQKLQQPIGKLYSNQCRADLGDADCTVNLASFTINTSVNTVTNNYTFTASINYASAWFQGGLLTWTSGLNAGLQMEVKIFTTPGSFQIVEPMPYTVSIGDGFSVYAGCNKATGTCISKFNNIINFRGEPFIPGIDLMVQYPGGK